MTIADHTDAELKSFFSFLLKWSLLVYFYLLTIVPRRLRTNARGIETVTNNWGPSEKTERKHLTKIRSHEKLRIPRRRCAAGTGVVGGGARLSRLHRVSELNDATLLDREGAELVVFLRQARIVSGTGETGYS